jgi:hypothetical protein
MCKDIVNAFMVLKREVVGTSFLFNFVFHTISLNLFAKEIGALSGLGCATPCTCTLVYFFLVSGKRVRQNLFCQKLLT